MTEADVRELRNIIGTQDPSKDYNVIVDGFGTGLVPPTEEQLESMIGVVNVLDAIEADFGSLPTSIDLSTSPFFPAVGNQRSQPSCAAWAATYYAYGFLEAVDNNWTLASSGEAEQLISPAWTYARSNGGRDTGSTMDFNMMVTCDWGAATMATMPFDEHEYLDLGSPSAFREAPAHRAEEVWWVDYNYDSPMTTIDEIKLLVAGGTPVTFAMDALEITESSGNLGYPYILNSLEYNSTALNHAQTIVGYDDTITEDGDVGAFRVVNSWGTGFAEAGFYWFTYDTLIEIGDAGKAYLNYMSDKEDYSPSLVANWHFNDAPSRSAVIQVGIGDPLLLPLATKEPFVVEDRIVSHYYPTFMCVDVSEFQPHYESSSEDFFLEIGASSSTGTISSFKVESHEGWFAPGTANRTSEQSPDIPKTTPGIVTVTFPRYTPIDADDAVDASDVGLASSSDVAWIPVEDESAIGDDCMQTGDVAEGETTTLTMSVSGPVNVTFAWKASTEYDADVLTFSVPSSAILSSISGNVDWTEESCNLGEGNHTLYWSYTKNAGISDLDDTAWVDAIRFRKPPPSFSLELYYNAVWNESFEVTPIDILNLTGSALSFWYDWGDGSPLAAGNPANNHSASHVYEFVGDFDLTVWAADEYDNNFSESSVVTVEEKNARPTAISISAFPSLDNYLSGDIVRFDVEIMDPEGDEITVLVFLPELGVELSNALVAVPEEPLTISFNYTCSSSREAPYLVRAEVRDDAEHFSYNWDTISTFILVNHPPEAILEANPSEGGVLTIFTFNASASFDIETPYSELEVRWDWNGDGIWDARSDNLVATYQFVQPGWHVVAVKVTDGNGLSATASVEVEVIGEPIPEFSSLLVPIVAILALLLFMARARANR
ncbi:MAG: hypothetical protein JSU93_00265 [Methanobacteriota archaeon]|nr:MAG: hypothetical protein JSU93_00265 [Euryarchaeota archaeon]